jgi:hypothetical protein
VTVNVISKRADDYADVRGRDGWTCAEPTKHADLRADDGA